MQPVGKEKSGNLRLCDENPDEQRQIISIFLHGFTFHTAKKRPYIRTFRMMVSFYSLSDSTQTTSSISVLLRIFFSVWIMFPLLIISVRIVLLPSPGILTHFLNAVFCLPAQLSLSLCRICVALRNISFTARFEHIIDL